jgi:hypothetical protein
VLRVEPRAARGAGRIGEQRGLERARRGHAAGQQAAEVIVEPAVEVGAHQRAPIERIAPVRARRGRRPVGRQLRGQVDHAARGAGRPALAVQQLAHVGDGVERRAVRPDDRAGAERPAEIGDVAAEPQLRGLGLGHGDRVDHPREPRRVVDQRAADVGVRADRDPEHHAIEVGAADQLAAAHRRAAGPPVLEVLAGAPQLVAADQLIEQRLARPARQAVDVDQRAVRRAAHGLGLDGDRDPLDHGVAGGVAADRELLDGLEELEVDAARREHLVERREHGVAHAGLHLVRERAAVGVDHAQRVVQAGAGADPGLVAEHQLAEQPDRGRRDRRALGAVLDQPVLERQVVDLEPVDRRVEQVVGDQADRDREQRVERDPGAPDVAVVGRVDAPVRLEPREEPAEQPGDHLAAGAAAIAQAGGVALGCVEERAGEQRVGDVGDDVGDDLGDRVDHVAQPADHRRAAAGLGDVIAGVRDDLIEVLGARPRRGDLRALEQLARPAQHDLHDPPRRRQIAALAGLLGVGRELELPGLGAAADVLLEHEVAVRLPGLVPARERRAAGPRELVVHRLHHRERVVVEPEEQVEAVLLDPIGARRVAAARALAAEPPAQLVDRDVVALAPAGRAGQVERGGHRAGAAAEDRDPGRRHQVRSRKARIAAIMRGAVSSSSAAWSPPGITTHWRSSVPSLVNSRAWASVFASGSSSAWSSSTGTRTASGDSAFHSVVRRQSVRTGSAASAAST